MNGDVHLVRMRWSTPELLRSLPGGANLRQPLDLGYLIHCRLTAAFEAQAPKPFAVRSSLGATTEVLAYSPMTAGALGRQARDAAIGPLDPALDWTTLASKPLPRSFPAGRRLGFEVRVCPVLRRSSDGRELDVFLAEVNKAGPDGKVDRQAVYSDWLARQFTGARLLRHRVEHMQRVKLARFDGQRRLASLERPDVGFLGELEVTEPEAFHALLARGLGRHRSFGFGMLLLKPGG